MAYFVLLIYLQKIKIGMTDHIQACPIDRKDAWDGIKDFAAHVHINLGERLPNNELLSALDFFDLYPLKEEEVHGDAEMQNILHHYAMDRILREKVHLNGWIETAA